MPQRFRIVRADDRYNDGMVVGENTTRLAGGQYPAEFWIEGMTEEQVDRLCHLMSYDMDAGCDNLFYADTPES